MVFCDMDLFQNPPVFLEGFPYSIQTENIKLKLYIWCVEFGELNCQAQVQVKLWGIQETLLSPKPLLKPQNSKIFWSYLSFRLIWVNLVHLTNCNVIIIVKPKSKVPKSRPKGLGLTNHMGLLPQTVDSSSQKFWFVSLSHPSSVLTWT